MSHRFFRRELSALSLIALMVLAQSSFAYSAPVFDRTLQAPQQSRPFPDSIHS